MAIRRATASAVLGLLFLSLVAIFLLIPQNSLVTFLCILILIVSLIVAQSQRWRDIAVMAIFAAIVSLVAAYLFGHARFGDFGAVVVTLIWGGVLFAIFGWTQRNMLPVPKDRAILIINQYSGAVYVAEGPIAPPLMPAVERRLAVIPLYELADDARVEKVNTKRQNVDAIEVQIHYQVTDARSAYSGIPNRSQAQNEIARDMGKNLAEARTDVTFWEKLLSRQMRLEVDDIVREVVYDNVFAQNPVEVYQRRGDLANLVFDRLRKEVQRWGVNITSLIFERVDINPEVMRAINKANIRMDDTELEKIRAEREATRVKLLGDAQAQVEAERVARMVIALQKSGISLSADALREIVIDAIHASADVSIETAFGRPLLEGPKPSGDKKP
jgi:regulator of protease activity HflC (stomatin/prohibitin superfamily)